MAKASKTLGDRKVAMDDCEDQSTAVPSLLEETQSMLDSCSGNDNGSELSEATESDLSDEDIGSEDDYYPSKGWSGRTLRVPTGICPSGPCCEFCYDPVVARKEWERSIAAQLNCITPRPACGDQRKPPLRRRWIGTANCYCEHRLAMRRVDGRRRVLDQLQRPHGIKVSL